MGEVTREEDDGLPGVARCCRGEFEIVRIHADRHHINFAGGIQPLAGTCEVKLRDESRRVDFGQEAPVLAFSPPAIAP